MLFRSIPAWREGGSRVRALVAGIKNALRASALGRLDGIAVLLNGFVAELVHGNDQYLLGSVERLLQACGLGEVTLAHPDAALLEIFRQMYDSDILHPPMPYDGDALLSKRLEETKKGGRPQEIVRLANLWYIDLSRGQAELDEKVEEIGRAHV